MDAAVTAIDEKPCRSSRTLCVLAILALAFLLRAYRLQGQSLSSDEVVEASVARLSPRQITAYGDGFPPLYHLLLAGWTRLSPAPESGRWLSVAFGVATVWIIYRWALAQVGPQAALSAASLAAVSPLLVYFSQEMRAYSLYICLTTASLAFFFSALRTDNKAGWAGFVATTVLCLYVHYYAALTTALLGLLLVYYRPHWADLRRGLAAFTLVGCLAMPVLTLLPGDMAYQSDGYVAKAPVAATLGHTAFGLFGGFSLGPSLAELHESSLCVAAEQAAPWLALFGPAALWLLLRGWQELRTRTGGVGLVFLTIASAPVIAAAGVLADVGPKVRYWCWLVAPLVVWLGAGAARGWDGAGRWLTRAAFAALVGVNQMALISRYDDPRYANEDVRSVCEYIAAAPQGRIPVFVVADYMAPPVRYYLNSVETLEHWLPRVPHEPVTASEQLSRAVARPWLVHPRTEADIREPEPWDDASIASWAEDVKSIASPGGSFWLIYTRPFHGDAEGVLLQHLEKRGCITLERNFAGVQLYRGELKN